MAGHTPLGKKPTTTSLHPSSHSPKAIVQAITSPIKGSKHRWLAEKAAEVRSLHLWLETFARELASARAHQTPLSNRLLVECLALVSDLFLFGALANVRIHWEAGFARNVNGCTEPEGREIRINVTNAYDGNISPERYAVKLLGFIAHEALHAFWVQYVCREHDACWEEWGASGHGMAWQRMAFEVERALECAGVEGVSLVRAAAPREERDALRDEGVVWSPSRKDVVRYFGDRCPVSGRVYIRDWRDKLEALLRW